MQLRAGTQLVSVVSPVTVVVVRAPAEDVEVFCGGIAMVTADQAPAEIASPAPDDDSGPKLGKRYVHETLGLECMCTRGGNGQLTANGDPLLLKDAKPLPSSD
jgi:hypothetical protein